MNMKSFWFLAAILFAVPIEGKEKSGRGVFAIRKGEIVSVDDGKRLTNAKGKVIDFTLSPDQKYLVYITNEGSSHKKSLDPERVSMCILDMGTMSVRQVGSDLKFSCCLIMNGNEADRRGYSMSSLKQLNGAFWNGQNEVLVRMVNGKYDGIEFWLSMNGTLHGDI